WSQQAHVPETAIVAHEAGHVVDDDLEMVAALRPVLADRLEGSARQAMWSAWAHEAFADVFGTLQLGPAYAVALSDVLATAPTDQSALRDPSYPPPTTRIRLVAAVLALAGHDAA